MKPTCPDNDLVFHSCKQFQVGGDTIEGDSMLRARPSTLSRIRRGQYPSVTPVGYMAESRNPSQVCLESLMRPQVSQKVSRTIIENTWDQSRWPSRFCEPNPVEIWNHRNGRNTQSDLKNALSCSDRQRIRKEAQRPPLKAFSKKTKNVNVIQNTGMIVA